MTQAVPGVPVPETMTPGQRRWLLRFPWDWPRNAWAIALSLVEQWEDGPALLQRRTVESEEGVKKVYWEEAPCIGRDSELDPVSFSEADLFFLALLRDYMPSSSLAPGEAPQIRQALQQKGFEVTKESGVWDALQQQLDAIAAVLRGSRAWTEAYAPDDEEYRPWLAWVTLPLSPTPTEDEAIDHWLDVFRGIEHTVRAEQPDLGKFGWLLDLWEGNEAPARQAITREYREGTERRQAGEKTLAGEFFFAAERYPSAALCVAAADAYHISGSSIPAQMPNADHLQKMVSVDFGDQTLHLKLASLLLQRAGLDSIDDDLFSFTRNSGDRWVWDEDRELTIIGPGLMPECYPTHKSSTYPAQGREEWLGLAVAILAAIVGDGADFGDGSGLPDLLETPPRVRTALAGLSIAHHVGCRTPFDRLFDLLGGATEALHPVVESQSPSVALAEATASLSLTLNSAWDRLDKETKNYLANAQALYRSNIDRTETWDWALVTIELSKALEATLKSCLGRSPSVEQWWRESKARDHPNWRYSSARLGTPEFRDCLIWIGASGLRAAFLAGEFPASKAAWLLDECVSQLSALSDPRNHAAHAGSAGHLKNEAEHMYRAVLGERDQLQDRDRPGLIEMLMELRPPA